LGVGYKNLQREEIQGMDFKSLMMMREREREKRDGRMRKKEN